MHRVRGGVSALMTLLGLAFVFAGGIKLNDPARAYDLFASWGLGPWAVSAAGWTEVVLGLLLFNPPTRRVGAAALGAWMVLFGALQLRAGQGGAVAASATVLVLCLTGFLVLPAESAPPRRRIAAPLADPPTGALAIGWRLLHLVGPAFFFRWAAGGILYWLSLPVLAWAHAGREGEDRSYRELLLLYLLVLGLGVSGLWGFVGHAVMGPTVAASVGWDPSPFQTELAFYHLGLGVAGLTCWWIRDHFWAAVATVAAVFLYGAGWVHLRSFVETGNTAPTNWGFGVLFGNLIVPTVLLVLMAARRRGGGAVA